MIYSLKFSTWIKMLKSHKSKREKEHYDAFFSGENNTA